MWIKYIRQQIHHMAGTNNDRKQVEHNKKLCFCDWLRQTPNTIKVRLCKAVPFAGKKKNQSWRCKNLLISFEVEEQSTRLSCTTGQNWILFAHNNQRKNWQDILKLVCCYWGDSTTEKNCTIPAVTRTWGSWGRNDTVYMLLLVYYSPFPH